MEKIEAMAKYLECDIEDLTEESYDLYGLTVYSLGNQEYAIGDDEEADKAAAEDIKDSLWAFNTDFIMSHTKLPAESENMIATFQSEKCEDANDTIASLIEDMNYFIEDAISCDGRGHFLSSYDGEENEEGEYYIYRIN